MLRKIANATCTEIKNGYWTFEFNPNDKGHTLNEHATKSGREWLNAFQANGAKVGDKGDLVYRVTSSSGLLYFEKSI